MSYPEYTPPKPKLVEVKRPEAYPGENARANDGGKHFRILEWHEITFDENAPDFLVEDLLSVKSFTCTYGPPGSGKSYFSTDMAIRLAAGWPVQGKRVLPKVGVVYIACEAPGSLKRRKRAFEIEHGLDLDAGLPFGMIEDQLNLIATDDVMPLISDVKAVATKWQVDYLLIIIDTLSGAMRGGNENDTMDMNLVAQNCNLIRHATDATVTLVHHTGKNEDRGARGSNALRAAVDTEICITRDEAQKVSTATISKSRDGEVGESLAFTLKSVTVGKGMWKPMTSCVVEPAAVDKLPTAQKRPGRQLSPSSKIALTALHNVMVKVGEAIPSSPDIPSGHKGVTEAQWKAECDIGWLKDKLKDSGRRMFDRATDDLQAKGEIGRAHGWVWTTGQVRTAAGQSEVVRGGPDSRTDGQHL